jgi:hypothetical protein
MEISKVAMGQKDGILEKKLVKFAKSYNCKISPKNLHLNQQFFYNCNVCRFGEPENFTIAKQLLVQVSFFR